MFLSLWENTRATSLYCHQIDVIRHKGLFYGLGTFRAGKYLMIAKSPDGIVWPEQTIVEFIDSDIRYVNILRKDDIFFLYYVVEIDNRWSLKLAMADDIYGPYKLKGDMITPDGRDDYYCVGSCSTWLSETGKVMLWYTAMNRDREYSIHLATSDDGYSWKKRGLVYRYSFDDASGCSKPSVVQYNGDFYLFFSKVNPSGSGYWAIGAIKSDNVETFVEENSNSFNVSSYPYGAKYPCVVNYNNNLYMWSIDKNTFIPRVYYSMLTDRRDLKSRPLNDIISVSPGTPVVVPVNNDSFYILIDRLEIDARLICKDLFDINFSNGHVLIKSNGKIYPDRFTPNGKLKICLQRSKNSLRFIYSNIFTSIEYDLSIDNIGSDAKTKMEISIIINSYKKRNGHMLLIPSPE